ncbi:MAG: hypothetical protein J2P26_13875, partial [Nocardiopsaceae bacterium]|nr:hypothetical protein [Nocardiopsaceae bacterium]
MGDELDSSGVVQAETDVTRSDETRDPSVRPAPAARIRLLARFRRLIAAHRAFTVVAVAAAALRIVVMLGYPPVMFF